MASALTSIELASAVKADYDRSWIEPNARRAVLEPGGRADLVVHHHPTLREVLAHHAAPAHVIASGAVVASSTSATTFPD